MPKKLPRIRPDEDFVLDAQNDEFDVQPARGPRRFARSAPDPLWRRILMRPSLYIAPFIVGAAISAFIINAVMLQSGPRGAMTLGWPFNAISKASLDKLNFMAKEQPAIPMPPKRTDATDVPLPPVASKPATANAADPYAGILKEIGSDPAIERAQRVLNRLGYGPIPVDGTMSQALRGALQRFGHDRGLTPGPQTETAILKQLGQSSESAQN